MKLIDKDFFTFAIIAPPEHGKTTLAKHLIKEANERMNYDCILAIAPNGGYEKLIDEDMIFKSYSHDILKKLIKIHDQDPKLRTLVVFDDTTGFVNFRNKGAQIFVELITQMRHKHISLLVITHYFHYIPPVIRVNLTKLFFFKCSDENIIKSLNKTFCGGVKKNFTYLQTTLLGLEKYQFLVISPFAETNNLFNVGKIVL